MDPRITIILDETAGIVFLLVTASLIVMSYNRLLAAEHLAFQPYRDPKASRLGTTIVLCTCNGAWGCHVIDCIVLQSGLSPLP